MAAEHSLSLGRHSTPSTPLSSRTAFQLPSSPISPLRPMQSPLQVGSPTALVSSMALTVDQKKEIEREADQLFRVNSIEQIKSLEREKRLEIDRRKEDLRQMVGERYRDLIDAADSIMHMKKCSDQAKQSVSTMEQLCQRLQQTHFLRGSGGLRGPAPKSDDQVVAAQVKILADAPENIWICLENRKYLAAAHTYLLARHIFSQLSVKLGKGSDRNFAVVQRLWHSVATFKDAIIKCSNNHLQCLDLQQEHMVQSLCAIILLEGCSPRQVFAQTLLARKSSIQSVFSASGQHRSVKAQVCQLVKTVVESLTQISSIFCVQENHSGLSLLVQRLTQITKKQCPSDVIPAALLCRLPESITAFAPVISATSLTEIPAKDIHSSTQDWITMCVSDVHNGIEGILQHITTFKALAGIREAVHTQLSCKSSEELEQGSPNVSEELKLAEAREEWNRICQNLLGKELCVWDLFLRPQLLHRAKSLVDMHFGKAGSTSSKLLETLLLEGIEDKGSLWEEDQASSSGAVFNPLSLKAKACSPCVFSFCQAFDMSLKEVLTDLEHFLGKEVKGQIMDQYWKQQVSEKVGRYPFSLTEDSGTLRNHVQVAAADCIGRFLKNIDSKVLDIQSEIKENQDYSLVNRLVLMGSLCQCLMDCCPNFTFLASGCKQPGFAKSSAVAQKKLPKEQQSTAEVLLEKAISIFKIWSLWCSTEVVSQLKDQLSAEMELNSLASSLAWDEIQISEESESGDKVSSVIKVPSQSSVYVSSLLFALSQEINRVGGHALDRSLLEELSGNVLQGVVECYEGLLQSCATVPQSCALQLLFNLKFFSSVLVHPSLNDVDSRLKKLVESLQAYVDPFDLDVFMPYISANLDRQLTRSSVLFGVLLSVKGSTSLSYHKKPPSSNTQEQHIIIPLASSISRLPTLPMTSTYPTQVHSLQDVSSDPNSNSFTQTITFFHQL